MKKLLHLHNKRKYARSSQGFTLAELLIVLAIVGVLVAISIPIFSSQLKKARLAVDQANVRSAKAAAAAEYLADGNTGSVTYFYDGSKAIALDSGNLSAISSVTTGKGYGKSEAEDNASNETGASGTPKGSYVEVTVNDEAEADSTSGQLSAVWTSGGTVFDKDSGKLTLTGKLVSNGNILNEIKNLGLDPSKVTEIEAAEGSTIDNNTESVFKSLTGLKKVDLSRATLIHSSQYMFSDMPSSVEEIVLPKCSDPYNIAGIWYYADGSREGAKWSTGLNSKDDTRIEQGHSGVTIYRYNPVKAAAKSP